MKKLIILFFNFLVSLTAFCQSDNDIVNDDIDYYAYVFRLNWYNGVDGGEAGNIETAWKVKSRTSSAYSNDCNTANYNDDYCFKDVGEDYYYPNTDDGTFRTGYGRSNSEDIFYAVVGWENDFEEDCQADGNDDLKHCGRGTLDITNYEIGAYTYGAYNIGDDDISSIKMHQYWRYTNGQWGESPLDFGFISVNQEKSNYNSTTNHSFQSTTYGYQSTFSFSGITDQRSNDVTYQFTISEQPLSVNIDITDNIEEGTSSTVFNGNLYLLKESGNSYELINTDLDKASPSISTVLDVGTYIVVFEGQDQIRPQVGYTGIEGEFKISIEGSEAPFSPGNIEVEDSSVCEGVNLPSVLSRKDAFVEVLTPSGNDTIYPDRYHWERKRLGLDEWNNTGISDVSEATLDPVGQMNVNQNIAFRRRAVIGTQTSEWIYDTVFFQPSSITSGSISYGYDDYVRENYVLQGNITPSNQATGDPEPLSYRWEKRVPNATSYTTIKEEGSPYDSTLLTPSILGGLDEEFTNLRRVAINGCGAEAISNEIIIKGRPADGSIEGYITAPPIGFGPGIKDVEVCAIPLDPIYGVETVCDTTSLDGYYLLDNLYYGEEEVSRYKVEPKLIDHVFRTSEMSDDSSRTIELTTTTHNIQVGTNFVDLSVFTAQGNVYQKFEESGQPDVNYGKSKVVIYLEDIDSGIEEIVDTTGADGNYNIIIPNPGNWRITPRLVEDVEENPHVHTFSPTSQTLLVTESISNVDFENTTTMDISGFVGASCDNYLGTTLLRFYQDAEDGDFDRSFRTNLNSGTFDFTLPARKYKIEVVGNSIENKNEANFNYGKVEDQFAGFLFDAYLSHRDTSFELTYIAPPSITIEGVPDVPSCGSYGFPVLEQYKIYPDFKIKAWIGDSENACPLDTGYMDVFDGIGGRGSGRIPISNGNANFTLLAGEPNIVKASDYLLTNNFLIGDFSNAETASYDLSVLVTGGKAQKESEVTVSPQIPLLVLHDPPGDRSFSSFAQESSIEISSSTYAKSAYEQESWFKLKTGIEFSFSVDAGLASIGTSTKIINDNEFGTKTELVFDTTGLNVQKVSNLETISTSADPRFIGDHGDVFYGAAYNYRYAITDIIEFDYGTCSIDTSKSLSISSDSIATTFLLTTRAIENEIIELVKLRDSQSSDSTLYFQNQINIWQQTLNRNRQLKAQKATSNDTLRTLTFSGGLRYDESETITNDTSTTIEFMMEIDKDYARTLGLEIGGVGFNGGYMTNFKTVFGTSNTERIGSSVTVDYTLEDDDPDDEITVKIYKDTESATPIFISDNSRTSCPYEDITSLGTDNFIFSYSNGTQPFQTGVDPDIGASYQVLITNNGLFNRTYNVSNDPAYNPDAAEVSIGGSAPGLYHVIDVAAGSSAPITITVNKQPSVNVYSYRNLKINVDPICNVGDNNFISLDMTRQSLFLSATFISDCSNMDITTPTDYVKVNREEESGLALRVQEYDRTKLDRAILQYRLQGDTDWKSSANVDLVSSDLFEGESGTLLSWNLNEVSTEGLHEIRFRITCTTPGTEITNVNYSNTVIIDIDRIAPQVYGIPKPIDDNYDVSSNDEIGVTFNEVVCNNGNTEATAVIVDLIVGDTIQTTISCSDNSIKVVEQGSSLILREPSIYRVIMSNVSDLAGNIADDTRWVFTVGDFTPEELGCIAGLYVSNNNENEDAINVANYQAMSIQSAGRVPGFGETTFKAQESITFEPGFEVDPGGEMLAEIETCENE